MDYYKTLLEMRLKFSRDMLKLDRKAFKTYICLFAVTLFLFIWNASSIATSTHPCFSAFSSGGLLLNLLWFITYILDAKYDVRLSKELINLYEKHISDEDYRGALAEFQSSKKVYEDATAEILAERFNQTLHGQKKEPDSN